MNNSLISVIIPVYNNEAFLDKCLLSVINQTYKNLEIIVINDGSTDSSLEIISKYKESDNRIRVINSKNEGGAAARNKGLDIASGDYYAFVDSDDEIELDMYETMMSYINQYNCEMCICDFAKAHKEYNVKKIKHTIYDNHELMKELMIDEKITSHFWRKIYPAKVFKTNRFPNKKVVHDMSLDHLLLKDIEKAVYIKCPLYIYNDNNTNNLSNSNAKSITSSYNRAKVMMERLEFCDAYYPDLSDIIIPKLSMFLLSSYAKIKTFNSPNNHDILLIKKSMEDNFVRIKQSNQLSAIYKIAIFSIVNNWKFLSNVFCKAYIVLLTKTNLFS